MKSRAQIHAKRLANTVSLSFVTMHAMVSAQQVPSTEIAPIAIEARAPRAREALDEVTTWAGEHYVGQVDAIDTSNTAFSMRVEERLVVLQWSAIASAHGPSFPASDATIDARGASETYVRLVSERRQPVTVSWAIQQPIVAERESVPQLVRVRCMTNCLVAVPVGRVELQVEHRPVGLGVEHQSLDVPLEGTTVRVRSPSSEAHTFAVVMFLVGGIALNLSVGASIGLLVGDPTVQTAQTQTGLLAIGSAGLSALGLLGIGGIAEMNVHRGFDVPDLAPRAVGMQF